MSEQDLKKSLNFRKILTHPDKNEIIEKLVGGYSVRQVSDWLKRKYPVQPRLQISYVSLQNFRKYKLKIDADDIIAIQNEKMLLARDYEDVRQIEEVHTTESYRKARNLLDENLIDYNGTIIDLLSRCQTGIKELEVIDNPKALPRKHEVISKYLSQIQGLIESHHKISERQEKRKDNQSEKDYTTLKRQVDILKEATKEVFREMAPELLPIFVQKIKEKVEAENV